MKKKNKTPAKQKKPGPTQTSIDSFFSPASTQPGEGKSRTVSDEKKPTQSRKRTPAEQPSSSSAKKKNRKSVVISLPSSPPDQSTPILIEDDDDGPSSPVQNQQPQASRGLQTVETITCPVCSKVLDDGNLALAERHINLCLDRPISSTSSPPKPTPKPERPECPADEDQLSNIPTDGEEEEETNDFEGKEDEGSVKSLLSETKIVKPSASLSTKPRAAKAKKKGKKTVGKLADGKAGGKKVRAGQAVPFYKLMPGTTLSVDCFSHGAVPGVTGYFLSHAHSDHYTKLSSSWKHGKIYCSKTTANLVKLKLRVDPQWVVPLDFNRPYTIDDVRVVLIDANHCPGSAMFLFEGMTKPEQKPFRYLHCGDFRAAPSHLRHPEIHNKVIDICYLDTTYLDPKYCFPAQEQVIEGCCRSMSARVLEADRTATMSSKDLKNLQEIDKSRAVFKSWLDTSSTTPAVDPPPQKEAKPEQLVCPPAAETPVPNQPKLASIFEPRTKVKEGSTAASEKRSLILVGTYSIGKERIVIELARRLSTKVFCSDHRKRAIIGCIDEADEEAELKGLLTTNPYDAQIHLVNLFALNKPGLLESHLAKFRPHFNHIIGIKPTGWCYKPRTSIPVNSLDLHTFIDAFQQQEQYLDGSPSNRVGRLIFPEKVKPDLAHIVEIYGVPYSEHSSFFELSCFCISFDWVRIIPTVNCGSPASRAKMKAWIDRWKLERLRLLKSAPPSVPALQPGPGAEEPAIPQPSPAGIPSASLPLLPTPPPPALLVKPRDPLYW